MRNFGRSFDLSPAPQMALALSVLLQRAPKAVDQSKQYHYRHPPPFRTMGNHLSRLLPYLRARAVSNGF